MNVERFTFEPDGLASFISLGDRVFGGEPTLLGAPRPDVAEILSPHNELLVSGAHAVLLVEEQGRTRGRMVAFAPRGFEVDGAPAGVFGLFCVEDGCPATTAALFEHGSRFLQERGVRRVLGPIDVSTWFGHRFVTEGYERGPFFLEPVCCRDDAALWQAAGFERWLEYATLRIPHTRVHLLELSHRRASAAGILFSPLEESPRDELLHTLYEIARRGFEQKAASAPISRQQFFRLYRDVGALLTPGLSWLARSPDGEAQGFLFGYPDLLEVQRTGAAPTTTVLKTLAITREAPPYLGWALAHKHVEAARELGFTHGLYALMEKWRELLRYAESSRRMLGGELGILHKRYALFARPLV